MYNVETMTVDELRKHADMVKCFCKAFTNEEKIERSDLIDARIGLNWADEGLERAVCLLVAGDDKDILSKLIMTFADLKAVSSVQEKVAGKKLLSEGKITQAAIA